MGTSIKLEAKNYECKSLSIPDIFAIASLAHNEIIDSESNYNRYVEKPKCVIYLPKITANQRLNRNGINLYVVGVFYTYSSTHIDGNPDWSIVLPVVDIYLDITVPGTIFTPIFERQNNGWLVWKPEPR